MDERDGRGCAAPVVLLVEDDPIIAELTRRHLARSGAEVVHARCGEDALGVVAARTIDLVLLDHGLPDLDGGEVTARLRATPGGEQLTIVWLTGDPTLADHPASRSADAVIGKPIHGDDLRELVARWTGTEVTAALAPRGAQPSR